MNVFDEEMELLEQTDALRVSTLVAAGLTRAELMAYESLVSEGAPN